MKKLMFFGLVLLSNSCVQEEKVQTQATFYFDLENYFESEAARLNKANPKIRKTVVVNGEIEEKEVQIADWKQEFEAFIDSDINKAAWRGSFKVKNDSATTIYLAQDEKIPVKKLVISFKDNKVSAVVAIVKNTNKLYTSSDSLAYYPDSLYQIKKMQQIRFMQSKNYDIKLNFK